MIEFREVLQYRCTSLFHLYTGIFHRCISLKIGLIMKKNPLFKLMYESKVKRECLCVYFFCINKLEM